MRDVKASNMKRRIAADYLEQVTKRISASGEEKEPQEEPNDGGKKKKRQAKMIPVSALIPVPTT